MPKVVDRDRYRRELLSHCLELFAERGYGSITMRQIAEGLDVSTGTLYHYFPSKEGIFIQLVQELCERDIAEFLERAPVGESLRERLQLVTEFFRQHFQHYQQQLFLWIDFYQHGQRHEIDDREFLNGLWQRIRDSLAAYLQESNPDRVDFILTFMDGMLLHCIYERDREDPTWIARQLELLVQLLDAD
ncbi:MAG: TetR/AcrR family transcriptional regulator [Cyanobacteria bacterium P01_E01_bin.48]